MLAVLAIFVTVQSLPCLDRSAEVLIKHSPRNNAQTLGLHEPVVRLTGIRRQKVDQRMTMFDEDEARAKGEEHDSGNRDVCRFKDLMGSVSQAEPCNVI